MSANDNDLPARFKQALQESEKTRSPEPVAALFADGAQLTNLGGDHGHDAKTFWQTYFDQFREIRSEFTRETVDANSACMEWTSRGTTTEGTPVDYRGISVIEFGDDRITGFRTYYDSAAFVRSGR